MKVVGRGALRDERGPAALTPRQREILELVARGHTNESIGHTLDISPATVRTHVTAILDTLGVNNRTEAAALFLAPPRSGEIVHITPVLARPALLVLPPTSDGSPGAEALAGALREELAGLFARGSWFPVIARSSSLDARTLGDAATRSVGSMGRALGARFVVDAALRASGGGWRLSVQVDDSADGHCVWTERYDFARDPFDAIDEVCAAIVSTVYPVLATRVRGELAPTPHPDMAAWELAYRAFARHGERDLAGNTEATTLSRDAIARDPSLVVAHFVLGLCAYDAVLNQWGVVAAQRDLLAACGERCVALAPHAAEGFFLLGRYHQTRGDHVAAIAVLETAVARNPSFAAAHALLAQALNLCGREAEALVRMQHAHRLGPRSFVAGLATLRFAQGDFRAALEDAERAIALTPRYTFARVLAAAAAWWAGETERGRAHLAQLRELYPAFDPSGFLATFGAHVPAVERVSEGVRRLDAVGVCASSVRADDGAR